MRKRVFTNISKITALPAAVAMMFTGCSALSSSSETDPLLDDTIKQQLKESLNNDEYAIDELTNFSYEYADFTDEEKETLSAQFTGKATIRKARCSFSSTSIERGITGTYDLIFANVNNEWMFISGSAYDAENWVYSAKDVVSMKQIRDDLKTIDIPDLNGSHVGDESDTEVEISERQSDIENGNESMKASITYNAKFAIYKFNIKLQYQFKDGKWVLETSSVDDQEFWDITFDESMKPAEPKEKYIISELSDSSNYKSYMMNLSYVDNYYLTKGSETVHGSDLSYNYVLIVTYNEFGDIEYNIEKKYHWQNNAWQEGNMIVSVKAPDWSKMIGTWASTNGDFLRVKDAEGDTISGTYTHKYADDNYVTYSVTGKIDLELTDNDWDLDIEQGEVTAGEEQDLFVILPFKVDLKNGTITSNGNIYVAKGDEDGDAAFHTGDNSYYEEKDDEDISLEHNDDYDSGIDFWGDKPETEAPAEGEEEATSEGTEEGDPEGENSENGENKDE